MSNKTIIAVDISKEKLDIYCPNNKEHFVIPSSNEGFHKLDKWMEAHGFDRENTVVVFENTGSYGRPLIKFCTRNNLKFYQLNALDISRSKGLTRGKNDKHDAILIASYFREKEYRLKPSQADSQEIEALKDLRATRDLLVKHRASIITSMKQDTNVLGLSNADLVVKSKLHVIKTMDQEIKILEQQIDDIVRSNSAIKATIRLLTSIVGVGPIIAMDTLLATDNFRKFDTWRQYASFTGSAPFPNESGKMIKPKRISKLARKDLKAHLSSGARSAVQYDQELKLYFERKIAQGKSKDCVINCVRAKLIARMFAVIRKKQEFKRNYSHTLAISGS